MIKRITIPLEESEFKLLFEISQKELRNPIEQGHYFIREALNLDDQKKEGANEKNREKQVE